MATTRAKEILILIDHEAEQPLPFLRYDYEQIKQLPYVNFIGNARKIKIMPIANSPEKYHNTTVSELVRYISEDTMKYLIPLVENIFEELDNQKSKNTVDIPISMLMDNGLTEDISNLNGLVIPQLYEESIKSDNLFKKLFFKKNIIVRDKIILDNIAKAKEFIIFGADITPVILS